MKARGLLILVIGIVVVAALGALAVRLMHREPAKAPPPVTAASGGKPAGALNPASQIIAKGEYLARAGDCVACHTEPNNPAFAGGRAMPTPFGNLYVPNITPDDETGIGQWSADDFYRMMHTGVSRDGSLLYPAMPFASYTKVTREDSDAIYAYLMSVPPVKRKNHPHELRFPFNKRELLIGWRTLYFTEGEFKPDPSQSAQWNRGAYLVQGLGHCAMCHTAINALGGSSESKEFEGGMIPNQNWYAPSLTSNREAGLGNWPIQDIVDLLQVGVSHRATVYGPMAEVVYNSLQYMTDEDVQAMAVYLKALPQRDTEAPPASHERLVQPAVMEAGRQIYLQQCAMCHAEDGKGHPPSYPPLAANQSITMSSPVNAIRMVLNGGYAPGTQKNPRPHGMPPFSHILNDDQAAAVVTYIRVAWGNTGTPVAAPQVNELRKLLPE
ncbi:cytochrome c [Cupriavidus taiwanensis]|uniref:Gluconate 2-dehydrogenase (Acceptor) n=1 Tax=Cupriavidus taiwanensis TaxID=164546 RepID=A0A375IEH2_9BURK|nr:cytochrome c [Cupriavidus taiwanensis]SOZ33659.1 Gluconate 2-dehydrogenase (Acceptor) [Cupriavidus taiwanensis]SPA38459.1 Gluconate 2-dehydrogenase (Acceptor) [Cupriavidus taiwanensis]SPA43874.1 Gluconate 2-dehydrogenase (Acceptor) [Cupriavidus taiwanensis]SPK72488.1 Gluconate 2-dehydrogenase (Acceptor) [Cupriavidus taiwanensis]